MDYHTLNSETLYPALSHVAIGNSSLRGGSSLAGVFCSYHGVTDSSITENFPYVGSPY